MSLESMWSIPQHTVIRTPYAIMMEQAQALTAATEGVFAGKVSRATAGVDIQATLHIVAPALNGYTFGVLFVSHQAISVFPAYARSLVSDYNAKCDNVGQFEVFMRAVLSSPAVQNAIGSLLAQSADLGR